MNIREIIILFCILIVFNSNSVLGQTNNIENTTRADSTIEELKGWIGIGTPTIDDTSSEKGFIKYLVTINELGYIIKLELIKSTISPKVENKYRRRLKYIEFKWEDSNTKPPKLTRGTITYQLSKINKYSPRPVAHRPQLESMVCVPQTREKRSDTQIAFLNPKSN